MASVSRLQISIDSADWRLTPRTAAAPVDEVPRWSLATVWPQIAEEVHRVTLEFFTVNVQSDGFEILDDSLNFTSAFNLKKHCQIHSFLSAS